MATSTTGNRTQSAKQQSNKGPSTNSAALLETQEDFRSLVEDMQKSLVKYGKRHPIVTAGAIFFAGFYVGWKIKPW